MSKFQRRHYIAVANTFVSTYNYLTIRPSRYWRLEKRIVDEHLNSMIQTFRCDNYGFSEYRFRKHIVDRTLHPEKESLLRGTW
jgi:hypothetical protein|tara:strand:- start:262 stop:510 length:249 start_codon:yes stop_codon:yes gene_type:complete